MDSTNNLLADNEHYTILGFDRHRRIVIHTTKGGLYISFHPRDLESTVDFLILAPLAFWREDVGIRGNDPEDWLEPASAIIDAAKNIGECSDDVPRASRYIREDK